MKLSDVIKKYRVEHGLSQRQMGAQCGLSTGYISLIEKEINPQTGKQMVPSLPVLNKISAGMGITLDALLAACDDMEVTLNEKDTFLPSNIIPMPKTRKIPRLGAIACGTPVLAEENYNGYDEVADYIQCDFTLLCKGDSMINARIYDGDIVCIRQQPEVENGEIAAVLIDGEYDGEATLKRVKTYEDHIILEPENPQYRPLAFWGDEMQRVHILGKATHFISTVK